MRLVHNDGGRQASGFKGTAGDCVVRAVAIASGRPYAEVHERLSSGSAAQRQGKGRRITNADKGTYVKRKWFRDLMADWGFRWVSTMGIGTGCRVHLTDGELPSGRLVVAVSRHYVAVIDGVIHDTFNPSRGGRRCVYGYWIKD